VSEGRDRGDDYTKPEEVVPEVRVEPGVRVEPDMAAKLSFQT
jgi:hypothetical protein